MTGIAIPAGSTFTRLSFWHRWRFESGLDGGTLAVSFDNFFYQFVPASAIIGGSFSYNGTVGNVCPPFAAAGLPIFTGVQSSFVSTTVNLDAICGGGGCGGQTLWLAFVSISDCSVTDDGWFLDNVQVTTCVP